MVVIIVLVKLDRDYCVSAVHINLILRTSIRITSRNYPTADISGYLMNLTFMRPCIVNVIFLIITNKLRRYTIFFFTVNAVHVSGGFSAHHQELKNCTQSIGYVSGLFAATASGSSKPDTYPMLCVQFLSS